MNDAMKTVPRDGQREKVAIIGCSGSSRHLAPFDDDTFDIWGLNGLGLVQKGRWSEWFEIHSAKSGAPCYTPELLEWLNAFEGPVWMREHRDDVRNSEPFPFQAIIAEPKFYRRFFTSTVAWMQAFAIYRGYKEIHLYGIDMMLESEYGYQNPACAYWVGLAEGMGINVVVPDESPLMKTPWIYGLEDPPEPEGIINERLLADKVKCGEDAKQQATAQANVILGREGALAEVLAMEQRDNDALAKLLADATALKGQAITRANQLVGAVQTYNEMLVMVRAFKRLLPGPKESFDEGGSCGRVAP